MEVSQIMGTFPMFVQNMNMGCPDQREATLRKYPYQDLEFYCLPAADEITWETMKLLEDCRFSKSSN